MNKVGTATDSSHGLRPRRQLLTGPRSTLRQLAEAAASTSLQQQARPAPGSCAPPLPLLRLLPLAGARRRKLLHRGGARLLNLPLLPLHKSAAAAAQHRRVAEEVRGVTAAGTVVVLEGDPAVGRQHQQVYRPAAQVVSNKSDRGARGRAALAVEEAAGNP